MATGFDARGDVPPVLSCGSYTCGHDLHPIQVRRSRADGLGMANRVEAVDDDGTIHFADGSTRWNHDPTRLRTLLDRFGAEVSLWSHGVLRIVGRTDCVSVSDVADPCRPETAEVCPGESLVDELLRRGGFLRRIS